jgi:hypothetical protein
MFLTLHLKTETDSVSKTLCLLVFRILDDDGSPESQLFRLLCTIVRTLPTKYNMFLKKYNRQTHVVLYFALIKLNYCITNEKRCSAFISVYLFIKQFMQCA